MASLFTKQSFQCNRYCGKCCKDLVVEVRKNEIEQIKSLGYKEEEFLERDLIYPEKIVLKRNKDGCIFLKKDKEGRYICSIYANRPKICQQYPFFDKVKSIKSCLPEDMYPNVLFRFSK